MTTLFYAPLPCFADSRIVLPEGEARHAVRVLRMRVGDEITVVDGEGGWYRGALAEASPEKAVVEIAETRREVGEPRRRVVLALGVLHHRDRFEVAVEKAVELGATGIVPLRSARAAPGKLRQPRLETIVLAAMKQSLRSRLPHVYDEHDLESTLSLVPDAHVLVAHEGASEARTPAEVVGTGDARPIVVLIGPEGGFTDGEVDAAVAAGAEVVSLGPRRLRAETAATTALADLMLHLG